MVRRRSTSCARHGRGAAADGLELVAIDGDEVIGHVLGAHGDLDGRDVVGIAPLAVTPPRHGQGIGNALMTEVLRRADDSGLPLVVLLGNPGYYGRFGFEPSGPLGITYRPVGPDNPHFMVRKLAAYDPVVPRRLHLLLGARPRLTAAQTGSPHPKVRVRDFRMPGSGRTRERLTVTQ